MSDTGPAPAPAPLPAPPPAPLPGARPLRWWHPLLGTLLIAVGWVFLGGLLAGVVLGVNALLGGAPATPERLVADPLLETAFSLAAVAAVLPPIALAARWALRRRLGALSSVAGRLRWRWLALCTAVAVPAVVLVLALTLLLASVSGAPDDGTLRWPGAGRFALSVVVLLALVPLQAAAEEYLARGWFVHAFGVVTRRYWPGVVVGGVVWTALHAPSTVWGVLDLLAFSVVAGWIVLRTGGLEAAIALHVATNVVSFVLAAALGALDDTGTAGDADWTLLAADAVVLPLYALAVVRLYGRRGPGRGSVRQAAVTPASQVPAG